MCLCGLYFCVSVSSRVLCLHASLPVCAFVRTFESHGKSVTKTFELPYMSEYRWRSYAQINDEVERAGAGLLKLGLKPVCALFDLFEFRISALCMRESVGVWMVGDLAVSVCVWWPGLRLCIVCIPALILPSPVDLISFSLSSCV